MLELALIAIWALPILGEVPADEFGVRVTSNSSCRGAGAALALTLTFSPGRSSVRAIFGIVRASALPATSLGAALASSWDKATLAGFAALAVNEPETGFPLASRVLIATDTDGAPVILISALSSHTRAIQRDGRVSLLTGEPGKGDPMAHPRMTTRCSGPKAPRSWRTPPFNSAKCSAKTVIR